MTKVWWEEREEQQQPRDPGSDLLYSLFFLRLNPLWWTRVRLATGLL